MSKCIIYNRTQWEFSLYLWGLKCGLFPSAAIPASLKYCHLKLFLQRRSSGCKFSMKFLTFLPHVCFCVLFFSRPPDHWHCCVSFSGQLMVLLHTITFLKRLQKTHPGIRDTVSNRNVLLCSPLEDGWISVHGTFILKIILGRLVAKCLGSLHSNPKVLTSGTSEVDTLAAHCSPGAAQCFSLWKG